MGGPGVPVGHVRGGLLTVGHNAAYAHLLHLYQRPGHHHRHIEGVGHPVRLHHLHHELGSSHPCHDVLSFSKYHQRFPAGWRIIRPAQRDDKSLLERDKETYHERTCSRSISTETCLTSRKSWMTCKLASTCWTRNCAFGTSVRNL